MKHVHGVDLLEGTVLGLDDEEEDDPEQCETAATKDEAVEVVNVTNNDLGEEGDEEVEQPVGGGSESHARSTVLGRVELGNDGPDEGTPGGGKGDDEEAGEDDEDVTRGLVGYWINEVADKGVDHEADEGPSGTDHKSLAATTLGNNPETTESAEDVDRVENDLGNVGVLETSGGKDGCTVVEEEVGTGELLASLEGHTKDGTVKHTWASENLHDAGVGTGSLLLKLDANVVDLVVDFLVVWADTSKTSNNLAGFLLTSHTVCETGGLGEE